MHKKKESTRHKFKGLFKGIDMFGEKVSDKINIKGNTTFRTISGGICSLIVVIFLLVNVITRGIVLFTRG